ncbi:MAG: protein kinase [Vicinamibacteria bacterium]|jgi:membrane-associated phospholipid phosphatase|nr:protein kinase [Vicinamibacteria bacterium]
METALAPGQTIGHYVILDRLGRGGMGEVFSAKDTRLDRTVALKVLPPEMVHDPERMQRFSREAKTLAALSHPNIVTIFSIEEIDEWHVLVMELVAGQTLRGAIAKEGLGLARLLEIAESLAEALAAAHERGVTHRDLKPENIMLTDSGRLKVLDFGLAKITTEQQFSGAPDHSTLTRDGVILGTVPYMSPEQAQGKPIDQRSDVFSLGIIIYELLTGQRPFQGGNLAELISSILRDAPRSISTLRPQTPPALKLIIKRCLEKAPKDRFQSAGELHAALRALRHELVIESAISSGRKRMLSTTARRAAAGPGQFWLRTRRGLAALLGVAFAVNFIETGIETILKTHYGLGTQLGYRLGAAAHAIEGYFSFERHDMTNAVAVYGYAFSYFFILPALFAALAIGFARRESIAPFRVLMLALVLAYAISLPCYVFFPVPERWALPDSEAILLSDLWSSRLIEAFRPISGLDNCFPSYHTASTVILVWTAYLFGARFRTTTLALGLTIILSTFVLGIHWLTDIVAGIALGLLCVAWALRMDRRLAAVVVTKSNAIPIAPVTP